MAALTVKKKVKNATYYAEGLIRLENVRVSYPHLLKAFAGKGDDGKEGKAKFGIVAMLDKEVHAEAIDLVNRVIAKIKNDNETKVASDKLFMRDGDNAENPEYENHMIVSAREDKRPSLRDKAGNVLSVEDDREQIEELFYGGCYCHVLVRPWYQDGVKVGKGYGKRINAGVVGVMFVKHGEPFGEGRINDADAWDDVASDDDDDAPRGKKNTKSDLDDDDEPAPKKPAAKKRPADDEDEF